MMKLAPAGAAMAPPAPHRQAQAFWNHHTILYVVDRFFALPGPDTELAIAADLLHDRRRLDLRILDEVVGRPRRYSELQPLLDGANDNTLNRALLRLREDGVIDQRLDVRARTRSYHLTALGKLVVYRLQQMGPVHLAIDAYKRGQAAAEAG